jgi:hypothetical protein
MGQFSGLAGAQIAMSETKSANFTLSAGSTSVFILDLDDEEKALDIGRRIAEETGRAVTVRDESGIALATFQAPVKH